MKQLLFSLAAVAVFTACSPAPSGHSTRPDDAVIRGVHYIGVGVSDIESAHNFYRDTVDLEMVERGHIENNAAFDQLANRKSVSADSLLMRSSNAQLRFMQFANPSVAAAGAQRIEPFGPGIAHVCFQASKHTEAYGKFLEAGGTVIGDREMVQLSSRNPVAYAYARDLEHNIVEIEHVDFDRLDLPEPPKNDYRIRHVSLATPNIERAVDFYSVLLQENDPRRLGRWFSISGDKVDRVSGLKNSAMKFAFFQIRNTELEIIQYVSHPTETQSTPRPLDANGYNMIVFDVEDLDLVQQRLLAAGGSVATETTSMDGGEIFFGRDPDGNLLGFQRLKPTSALSSQNFSDNGI